VPYFLFLALFALFAVASIVVRRRNGATLEDDVLVQILAKSAIAAISIALLLVPVTWFGLSAHSNPTAAVTEDVLPGAGLDEILGVSVLGVLIVAALAVRDWWRTSKH